MQRKILGIIGTKPRKLSWIAKKLDISVDEVIPAIDNWNAEHKSWNKKDDMSMKYTVIGSGANTRIHVKSGEMTIADRYGYHKPKKVI